MASDATGPILSMTRCSRRAPNLGPPYCQSNILLTELSKATNLQSPYSTSVCLLGKTEYILKITISTNEASIGPKNSCQTDFFLISIFLTKSPIYSQILKEKRVMHFDKKYLKRKVNQGTFLTEESLYTSLHTLYLSKSKK